MFDFSGTLFQTESTEQWLRGVLDETGHVVDESQVMACAARLEAAGALPGGRPPQAVPRHLAELWRDRDLTAGHHRNCYTALAREAALPDPALAEALYERSCHPVAWRPYPDAEATLRELKHRGMATAVVSNIGWDLRAVFAFHDLTRYIDVFVLSCELGVKKPDPRIFQTACDKLALPPPQVLMVGDDRVADVGAAALGCPVHLVDHLPVDARPGSLAEILAMI
ncbi:HAD family hydrolase [Planomonospora sp. ID82291]|uniref:HAD family hydrolase n=1 Tax=Planomonospora sp. ID82291 TaxID=2738136 RepID=UPI0018C35C8A|nr:HAD-IA family hydrolase [Planomonospora sp. ID82291]MBG0818502.1 HAD-IA family hydrolase [Planomonospora sp. ID82291]